MTSGMSTDTSSVHVRNELRGIAVALFNETLVKLAHAANGFPESVVSLSPPLTEVIGSVGKISASVVTGNPSNISGITTLFGPV